MSDLPGGEAPPRDKFHSVRTIAHILDLSKRRTRELIKSGAIVAINVTAKPGGRPTLRISQQALNAFLATRTVTPERDHVGPSPGPHSVPFLSSFEDCDATSVTSSKDRCWNSFPLQPKEKAMKAVPQPLRWYGGKRYLAERIITLMPAHTRYCEPYFGGGAVLFAKPPEGVAEFVNDIHGELVNFYQILRDKVTFQDFQRLVEATPFSPVEFDAAKAVLDSKQGTDVERAHAFFVRYRQSRQGLAKCFATPTSRTRRGMNEQVSAWLTAVDGLPEAHARLRRVEVRQMEALDFIKELDNEETLHYCDPPYLHETRSTKNCYDYEMTAEQHQRLLDTLQNVHGKFLLSGYPSAMYDAAAKKAGWNRTEIEIDNKASSAKTKEKKVECLWTNF